MSLSADKALAAARTRILAEQLPDTKRDELIAAWSAMLEEVEDARSAGAAELILVEFRQQVEARLANRLLNAPLEAPKPRKTTI